MLNVVDWSSLLAVNAMKLAVTNFANGNIGRDKLYAVAMDHNLGPEVRKLTRPGVDRGRMLARKALSRRQMA